MSELEHKGVEVIRGDPKVAIRKQSLPLILTFVLMMGFSVADSIWVSGLGTSQLAALGFISPLFFIITGLGNGLGAGVSSSIARFIGACRLSRDLRSPRRRPSPVYWCGG